MTSFLMAMPFFFLLAIANQAPLPPSHRCNSIERDALLPYKVCHNWDPLADCCSWDNIQCDKLSGRVIAVDLSGCNLSGTFSSNSTILKLLSLQKLDLSFNPFSPSPIPPQITNLIDLRALNISSSNFIGSIPTSIGNLRNLEELRLEHNTLTGKIPNSIGDLTRLITLGLSINKLTGAIPASIGNLTQLTAIQLNNNGISGTAPVSIFQLPNLVKIDLGNNQIGGVLPATVLPNSKLQFLWLASNKITGKVPSWVFTRSLRSVILHRNNFTGPIEEFRKPIKSSLFRIDFTNNQIKGPIPSALFQLQNLSFVQLADNRLSGVIEWSSLVNMKRVSALSLSFNKELSLQNSNNAVFNLPLLETIELDSCGLTKFPTFLRSLEALYYLSINNNRMAGGIEFGVGWKKLRYLKASFNMLEGSLESLPGSVEHLEVSNNRLTGALPLNHSNLKTLDVSRNGFGGVLPWSLFSQEDSLLSTLDLSGNGFTGGVPPVVRDMLWLQDLNLSDNRLSGAIPASIGKVKNLWVLDMSFNLLSGRIPQELMDLRGLGFLNVSYNQLEGPIPKGKSFTSASYIGNKGLCGAPLPKPC